MARPKLFAQRIMVRLSEPTLTSIQRLLGEKEDRSDFLRQAAELEIAIRSLDNYAELNEYLITNETLVEFCAKAVRQAAARRIDAVKNAALEPGDDQ
ncbi:MAG: hypothetical protein PHI71_04610 [Acidiphilium sp.]|nr:hypothetical protein [Acidiphilium sp.]